MLGNEKNTFILAPDKRKPKRLPTRTSLWKIIKRIRDGNKRMEESSVLRILRRIRALVPMSLENIKRDGEFAAWKIRDILSRMRSTDDHVVLALSYMERIEMFDEPLRLYDRKQTSTRQEYFLTCLLLAHKYLDDRSIGARMSDYARCLCFSSSKRLIQWEEHVLSGKLSFDIYVTGESHSLRYRHFTDGSDILVVD